MKLKRVTVAVRDVLSGETVFSADGTMLERGKKAEVLLHQGGRFVFSERKKRKSDAERMTTVLLVRIQKHRDKDASWEMAAELAGIEANEYFRDLRELGGSAKWSFHVYPDENSTGYWAFAFSRDRRYRLAEDQVSGSGYMMRDSDAIARFSSDVVLTRK